MPLLARRAASATERTLVYLRMTMYIRGTMRISSVLTHQSILGRETLRQLAEVQRRGYPSGHDLRGFKPCSCYEHGSVRIRFGIKLVKVWLGSRAASGPARAISSLPQTAGAAAIKALAG